MNIKPPIATDAIVNKEGFMNSFFRSWTQLISRLSIIEGNGTPEGVIEANVSRQYHDLTGTVGNTIYIKHSADILGDKSKGWRVTG